MEEAQYMLPLHQHHYGWQRSHCCWLPPTGDLEQVSRISYPGHHQERQQGPSDHRETEHGASPRGRTKRKDRSSEEGR